MTNDEIKAKLAKFEPVEANGYTLGYNGNEDPAEDPDGSGRIWAITRDNYGFVYETEDLDDAITEFLRLTA